MSLDLSFWKNNGKQWSKGLFKTRHRAVFDTTPAVQIRFEDMLNSMRTSQKCQLRSAKSTYNASTMLLLAI
jgi:hypothetical protein